MSLERHAPSGYLDSDDPKSTPDQGKISEYAHNVISLYVKDVYARQSEDPGLIKRGVDLVRGFIELDPKYTKSRLLPAPIEVATMYVESILADGYGFRLRFLSSVIMKVHASVEELYLQDPDPTIPRAATPLLKSFLTGDDFRRADAQLESIVWRSGTVLRRNLYSDSMPYLGRKLGHTYSPVQLTNGNVDDSNTVYYYTYLPNGCDTSTDVPIQGEVIPLVTTAG